MSIIPLQDDITYTYNEIKTLNRPTRFYLGKLSSLKLIDGLLVEQSSNKTRIIAPKSMQNDKISSFHEDNHAGIDRTLSRLEQYYTWHGITDDVRRVVNTCDNCKLNKTIQVRKNIRSSSWIQSVSI